MVPHYLARPLCEMWETRLSTCAFYPPACAAHLIAGQLPNNDHGVMVAVMTPMVMTIRLRVSRDRKEGDERE
jgi:hypothetical protein